MSIITFVFLFVQLVHFSNAWLSITFSGSGSSSSSTSTSIVTSSLLGKNQKLFQQHGLLFVSRNTDIISMTTSTSNDSSMTEIIGNGRIGSFLAEAGACNVIGRDDSIRVDNEGSPIIVTTRNDALADIIEKCPSNRRNDLVFVQNGYLDDFLKERDLLDTTQVLLYLSVPSKGATPTDGVTSVNPEGLTTATGIHAEAFAKRLNALNMKCNVVTTENYRPAMFEKLIWICTYMLVGTARKCKSVGEAGREYKELVQQLINELVSAVIAKENIQFQSGTIERLAAYTDVVADFPCGVKEFEWRNRYFFVLGDELCPLHNKLLRECEDKGLLGFSLS